MSEKVVCRLMVEYHIPVHRARNKRKWASYHGELAPAPPNPSQHNFDAVALCQLGLTEITEYSTADGKVYLSAIIDHVDGKVIGAKVCRDPVMESAEDTLEQARFDHSEAAAAKPLDVRVVGRGGHYRLRGWIRRTQTAGRDYSFEVWPVLLLVETKVVTAIALAD